MLEHRDEQTNEIIRTLIDKVKKKKITSLKRAILEKRKSNKAKHLQKADRITKKYLRAIRSDYSHDNEENNHLNSSGYQTIDEIDADKEFEESDDEKSDHRDME